MQVCHLASYLLVCTLSVTMAARRPNSSGRTWRRSPGYHHENDVIKGDFSNKEQSSVAIKKPTSNRVLPEVDRHLAIKLRWFRKTDRNGDGFVSSLEYARTNSANLVEAHIVVGSFDTDHDGLISKTEYLERTANSVPVRHSSTRGGKRDCSVDLINACAVSLVRTMLRSKDQARCSKIKVFSRCVSKKARKCDSKTRKHLRSIVADISKDISSDSCRRYLSGRKRGHSQRWQSSTKSDIKRCSPTEILGCSKTLFESLLAGDRCDSVKHYNRCVRKNYKGCSRSIRKRLRKSIKTVRKSYRKFQKCP